MQGEISENFQTTGHRSRALREKLGITQTELANRMGFSRNYISFVENGREPSHRFIRALELIEQKPMHTFEHDSKVEDNLEGHAAQRDRSRHGEPKYKVSSPGGAGSGITTGFIPLLSWAQAGSAEAWDDLEGQGNFVGLNLRDARAVAVQIRGDTMAPQFPQGTIAIVYPSSEPKSGDLVLARLNDGTVLFKRLHVDGHRYTFISTNPQYPPVTVDKSMVEMIHPVGGTFQDHL